MGLAQRPTEIIPSSCPWPRLNRLSRSQPPPSPAFFPLPPRLAFASIILSSLAPRHKPTPPPHTNAHARPLRERERQTGDAHRSIGRKKRGPETDGKNHHDHRPQKRRGRRRRPARIEQRRGNNPPGLGFRSISPACPPAHHGRRRRLGPLLVFLLRRRRCRCRREAPAGALWYASRPIVFLFLLHFWFVLISCDAGGSF